MKALIIGGTTGFGKNIAEELKNKDFEIVVVGRSYSSDFHTKGYACDVGNLNDWRNTVEKIKKSHEVFDVVFFIVGYARAKSFKDLTDEDWAEHFTKNLTYVALGLQNFNGTVIASNNPIIITIGSQWSYKVGNDELVPYTISKHALYVLTKDFAVRNPNMRVNHYCVPTMDTPQNREVKKSFDDIGKEFVSKELADNQKISEALVGHCIEYKKTGKLLILKNGSIEETE